MKSLKILTLLIVGSALSVTSCKKDKDDQDSNGADGTPIYADVTPSFTANSTLLSTGNSQYFPILRGDNSDPMVFWSEKDGSTPKIRGVKLSSSNTANGGVIDVDIEIGANNTGESTNQAVAYDNATGKYLSVHQSNETGNFSMVGKLFTSTDQSIAQFDIDGPFVYTNDAPNRAAVAVSSNSIFGVVYHTNSGFYTSSKIAFKTVNANTGAVTPAAVNDTQTGIEFSSVQSQIPDIAWNSTANVFGIVYHSGVTTTAKIMFATIDESGNVITAPKVIHTIGNTVNFPKIEADGDGFAVIMQDYSKVKFGEEPEVSGTPAIRLKRITATGDVKAMTGDANLINIDQKAVLMSNPYLAAAYIHFDFIVVTPGVKYGVVWATQDAPYQIQFAEATFSGDKVLTSKPINVSVSTEQSDQPTVSYVNGKYVITYSGHTGFSYETRIVSQN